MRLDYLEACGGDAFRERLRRPVPGAGNGVLKRLGLVRLLDNAVDIASGTEEKYPFQMDKPLPVLATQLTSEGIELMGAYLRGEEYSSSQRDFLELAASRANELEVWMDDVMRDQAEDHMFGTH